MSESITEEYGQKQQILVQRFGDHICEIENDFLASFREAVDEVVSQAEQDQNNGEKGAISFIVFSFLYSSVVTNRYDIRLDLFDEDFYLDEASCSSYISYKVLGEVFEENITATGGQLRKDRSAANENQPLEARRASMDLLKEQIKKLVFGMLQNGEIVDRFSSLKRTKPATVMFGDFQNNQELFLQLI